MEGEGLPFGYTQRQKRSHAQMQADDRSASPTWRYHPFSDNHAPTRTGIPLFDDYAQGPRYERQAPAYPDYDPTAYPDYEPTYRYDPFDTRRTPAFEPSDQSPHPPFEHPPSASDVYSRTGGLHLPRVENMASPAPRRFAGDGFDYRRPVHSAREQDVASVDLSREEERMTIDLSGDDDIIDLTADDSGYGASQQDYSGGQHGNNDQQDLPGRGRARGNNRGPRLPRGMDIIIDLDNGDEDWMVDPPEPGSPEIEFISSRTLHPPRLPPIAHGGNNDGDDVQFVRENALPEEVRRRNREREVDNVMDLFGTLNGHFTHLRAQVDRFNSQVNRTANRFHEPIVPNRGRGHAHVRVGGFVAPIMDFDVIGFDMGPRGRQAEPPPTYDAPEKAPEGFTRSPDEEGALVCPNCGDELCVGENEVKKQVWVVKACGHVYCGECTTNRAAKRTTKGKERPTNTNPFKLCVVESCDKHVSHKKSMIQVFM
ncbi:hypothetical protein BDW02DRAFT_632453 [Decorospora gaudefroyi]|uniref:Uncharacterized protein n=1 Tax=Decorospora gaudefroyi TaxID=184978 RepID=A0A6A5KBU4_9PLEO|nr:hypothetical protein BDW02DRAFT_632453 [Decorospora gaudefroyi]